MSTPPDPGEYVIVHVGNAGVITGVKGPGKFLKSYDPDWQPPGYTGPQSGRAEWTDNIHEAMHFSDQVAAYRCYMAQSKTVPVRPDGKPNRPLTAYSILCSPLSDYVKET